MAGSVRNIGAAASLVTEYVAELRDTAIQGDRLRFRRNLERLGTLLGYEVSKELPFVTSPVKTPLGIADVPTLAAQPVVGAILRAGLALHQGVLSVFDRADNAFISAFRAAEPDGSFSVKVEYLACPSLEGRVLLMCDPMLATGTSMVLSLQMMQRAAGLASAVHVLSAVATPQGIDRVLKAFPKVTIWTGAVDSELNAKSYIVPGLGDAGDLAYGEKMGGE